MGMFDTLVEDCPNCGKKDAIEFQSKAGPRMLARYTLATAPMEVLVDVNNDGPSKCSGCSAVYYVYVHRYPAELRRV